MIRKGKKLSDENMRTPNIDAMSTNGVRCMAGYVTAPQCSPSRAGLVSGRYQQRFGHEENANGPVMLMLMRFDGEESIVITEGIQ